MILMTVHFPPLKLKTRPTHVITHGVLLKVNPDRPNIHRMSAESRPELRDLRRIALARIPGSIAREPVRVDVRDRAARAADVPAAVAIREAASGELRAREKPL